MARGLAARLALGSIFLGWVGSAPAEDAAALVRSVREREAWVDRAESLSLRFEVRWELTPEGVEHRRRELQAEQPGVVVEGHPQLRPKVRQEVEIAFGRDRLRYRDRRDDWNSEDLRVWDGRRCVCVNRFERAADRDSCRIDRDPAGRIGRMLWIDLPSFRAGAHAFWWTRAEDHEAWARMAGQPDDFAYGGKVRYRGVECHVLNHWDSWTTMLVAVDDGRPVGLKVGNRGEPAFERRLVAWYRAKTERARDLDGAIGWLKSLTPERRAEVGREQAAAMTTLITPCFEFWYADETEIAPGCHLPMTQGSVYYFVDEKGQPEVEVRREVKILEALANKPLPDSLFATQLRAGDLVLDDTHEPPLQYRHRDKFTDAEWAEIVERGKKRAERDRARAKKQAELIGQAAPAFPEGATWIGGDRPSKSDLAGKVVLLDFWAEWCGPCRADLPGLAAIHRKRGENGLVVIGIHPPGSDPEAIRKVMADFEMTYPTMVDAARQRGSNSWGDYYERLAVDRIPHVVVLDRRGKVAATGTLSEVFEKAVELTRDRDP